MNDNMRMIEERRTFDCVGVPEGAFALIEWLQGEVNKIPTQYRSHATISFDAGVISDYGDVEREISLAWSRPATKDEIEERERRLQALVAARMDGWSAKNPWARVPDKYYPAKA